MSDMVDMAIEAVGLSGPGLHGTMSELASKIGEEIRRKARPGDIAELSVSVSGTEVIVRVSGSSRRADERLRSIVDEAFSDSARLLLTVIGDKFGREVE